MSQSDERAIMPRPTRKKRRRAGLFRILLTAAIFVVVLGTVFLLVFYGNSLDSETLNRFLASCALVRFGGRLEDVDITFDASMDNYYYSLKNGFMVLSPDGLRIYNWNGKTTLLYQPAMKNMAASAAGNNCIVYDREGTSFAITDNVAVLYEGQTEGPITSARYFDNGYCVIISSKQNYRGELTVFDKHQKERFKWSSSKRYIVDAAVSQDGSKLSVLCVDQENGRIKSSVVTFELDKEDPVAEDEIFDCIPIYIGYFENGGYFALMEDRLVFYDRSYAETEAVYFTGRYMRGFAQGPDTVTVLLGRYKVGGLCELVTYDGSAAEASRIYFENEVSSFSRAGESTAVLHSGRVTVYGEDGNVIGESEDTSGVYDIIMHDERTVIFIGESTVRLFTP